MNDKLSDDFHDIAANLQAAQCRIDELVNENTGLRARLAEYESAPPAATCSAEYYRDVLAKISDYTIALRSGGPAPEDLQELSDALEEVTGMAYDAYTASSEQTAHAVEDDLYKIANRIASIKNWMPNEWQNWAEELETDIRRAAMLANGDKGAK